MKKCVVFGAGFAGLTSAVYLSKAGFNVTLLESSPKPGGRAYSFEDKITNDVIDNGQHIMMGCYNYTLDLLKEIGAENNLIKQPRLEIIFVKENFKVFRLSAPSVFYPVNLLAAISLYKALSVEDRLKFISMFTRLPLYSNRDLEKLTVAELLKQENQSGQSIDAFWEILVAGALNTNMEKASAKIFADMLKKIFLKGNKAATILIPKYGLSKTYCEPSINYIMARGGEVMFGESVIELRSSGHTLNEIITNKRVIKDFDFAVSAVPLFAYNRIKKVDELNVDLNLEFSSILSVHLWLNKNNLKEKFYGFINSTVHWVFNHEKHITIVISNADEHIDKSNDEIYDFVCAELDKFLRIKKSDVLSYKIIKEKRATFIPSKETLTKRPQPQTYLNNFYLAGDWTDTGLPSTIESAAKSGRRAADLIVNSMK